MSDALQQYTPPEERGTRIAMLSGAQQAAIRIKDVTAIRDATEAKLTEMAETAREYRALFPHGGDHQGASTDALTPDDYCEALGWSQRTVQRWGKQLLDADAFHDEVEKLTARYMRGVVAEAQAGDPFAKQWTGETQWYTPAKYIESARALMGGIDLDPASSAVANKTVRATTYYTEADDGLTQDWRGRVWLNPPYRMPAVKQFAEKLLESYSSGDVTEAIVLTNNATDTSWWHLLSSCATLVCFTSGRISFYNEEGEHSAPTNGQNFHYFGPRPVGFVREFCEHGLCMVRA